MKIMTFNVKLKEESNIISLIQEIDRISCRIQIDFENDSLTVENVETDMIDTVIELVNQYYTISIIKIDNTSDDTVVETLPKVTDVDSTKRNVEGENNPTIVGPQSEDDLIIRKMEFKNEYVEEIINKFMRTAYWAIYKCNVSEIEIGDFLWSTIKDISMKYSPKQEKNFSIGDIVECNYGMHLPGEINGGHVFAIVCNITNMVYLVPVIRNREDITSHSYITFDTPKDVVYTDKEYSGGTALIDKGRYLRVERINKVVGRTTPEFFNRVLKKLSTTFNFINNTVTDNDILIKSQAKKGIQKVGVEETALMNVIGNALEKLDRTKMPEDQIESFLTNIGMVTTERMITQSFLIACNMKKLNTKKINYENIIAELNDMFKVKDVIIKTILKDNFKKWLEANPEIVKYCPKVSFSAVLKLFAKRFA